MTAENKFWEWFIAHQDALLNFEADQEHLFDQVAAALQKVDPNLCFEFGPKESEREFVISAGGIKDSFPSVIALKNTAPVLPGWRITAFRPRHPPIRIIEFQGKHVDPGDVQFTLLDNGKIAGLYLFLPDFQEGDLALKQIGYLLLDEALGEYDVETRLGLIQMLPIEATKPGHRYPFAELPSFFDKLVSQLEGRSDKPS